MDERHEGEVWLEGSIRLPVYYEDTDFSGYVYHANYLKFFERGREELIGLAFVRELFERGVHYVVARVEISYQRPARHADILEIRTRMRVSASPVSLVEHSAHRIFPDGATEPLVSARIKLACVNSEGSAIRVPQDVVARFRERALHQNISPA